MDSLGNKVFIITGASSGLGRAIARGAAAAGARLALCGRSPEKLASLERELGGLGPERLLLEAFDVTELELIAPFTSRVVGRFGRVDVLVNCAGANSARSPLAGMDMGDLEAMMRLNCYAPAAFMRACHGPMAAAGAGLVINILSTCCLFANEGLGAYTASKDAFEGLTKVYRKEARRDGIRVSAVYPGGINTAFRPQERPEYLDAASVAEAVLALVALGPKTAPDELVLRPLVESNYA